MQLENSDKECHYSIEQSPEILKDEKLHPKPEKKPKKKKQSKKEPIMIRKDCFIIFMKAVTMTFYS